MGRFSVKKIRKLFIKFDNKLVKFKFKFKFIKFDNKLAWPGFLKD